MALIHKVGVPDAKINNISGQSGGYFPRRLIPDLTLTSKVSRPSLSHIEGNCNRRVRLPHEVFGGWVILAIYKLASGDLTSGVKMFGKLKFQFSHFYQNMAIFFKIKI